ncbi:hypothetical protein CC80DRAFT_544424 [Byssothecium circinans]|uniref:DUF7730 domain-containing protein n=1 Tax=Byssothecium circinans TaxID=147558 RepID=A0A6A5UIX8_9PLEO|nr:hypothetical protein CC80DRAFT_544424 [Byssothecium circinans]
MNSAANQKRDTITTFNSINSPLLRLPGELRNMITEYALGNNVIMVEGFTQRLAPDKAVALEFRLVSPTSRTKEFGPGIDDRKQLPFSTVQGEPSKNVSLLFNLGLVCRQINAEATLFPYRYNVFHFNTVRTCDRFIEKLSTRQQGAISSISLGDTFIDSIILAIMHNSALEGKSFEGLTKAETISSIWSTDVPLINTGIRCLLPNLKRVYTDPGRLAGYFFPGNPVKVISLLVRLLELEDKNGSGLELIVEDTLYGTGSIEDITVVEIVPRASTTLR